MDQCLWCFNCGSLIGDHGSVDCGLVIGEVISTKRGQGRGNFITVVVAIAIAIAITITIIVAIAASIVAGGVDRCLWVDEDWWCLWVLMLLVLVMES